jgi:hypothetical protein
MHLYLPCDARDRGGESEIWRVQRERERERERASERERERARERERKRERKKSVEMEAVVRKYFVALWNVPHAKN